MTAFKARTEPQWIRNPRGRRSSRWASGTKAAIEHRGRGTGGIRQPLGRDTVAGVPGCGSDKVSEVTRESITMTGIHSVEKIAEAIPRIKVGLQLLDPGSNWSRIRRVADGPPSCTHTPCTWKYSVTLHWPIAQASEHRRRTVSGHSSKLLNHAMQRAPQKISS